MDLQAPKALWHEDRGRNQQLPRNSQYSQYPHPVAMQHANQTQVGALSQAAHRMLNNSMASVRMNGAYQQQYQPPQVEIHPKHNVGPVNALAGSMCCI